MLSLIIAGLSLMVVTLPTYGATCSGGSARIACGGYVASSDDAWTARQDYCGSFTWQTVGCITYSFDNSEYVTITNSDPGGDSGQVCWDAYEDIINQCLITSDYAGGNYVYSGITYTMNFCGQPSDC